MLGVKQAFRRRQFEDMNIVIQVPTMGLGTLAQFALGFRQGDIQAAFTVLRAGLQEVQGHGGFTRARFTFQQEQVAAR